ncbi:MAG: hypothetical protein JXP34_19575 [Planctomycetes bacterium]|nr:hypothetical protein [Planctomycetota bacterium]
MTRRVKSLGRKASLFVVVAGLCLAVGLGIAWAAECLTPDPLDIDLNWSSF